MTDAAERLSLHVGEAYGQMGVWVLDPEVSDLDRKQAGVPTLEDTYAAVLEENLRRAQRAGERDRLPPGVQCERVATQASAAELERRLAGERAAVWAEGDELTVALRTQAPFANVGGGFEMPLWTTQAPDIRAATVRIRNLPRATLSLRVIESNEVGNVFAGEVVVYHLRWRGPEAPPTPDRVEADERTYEVPSDALGTTRAVAVSMPDKAPELIVFGTDGTAAAPIVRALERKGLVPPVATFGVGAAMASGGDFLARLDEYYYGRDPAVFEPHYEFFTSELPKWIKDEFGVALPRERTVVHGWSAGGRFAAELPVLNPEQFGMAISLSSTGMGLDPGWSGSAPVYGVGSGTLEDPNGSMRKIGDTLSAAGASVHFHEWVGGHDSEAWEEAVAVLLPQMVSAGE